MSIIGIGSDIVKIERIERLTERYDKRFLERVFATTETDYAFTKARPGLHLAARFAAKEALVKALGSGLRQGLSWPDIEVINDPLGKPQFIFHNNARKRISNLNNPTAWLTLSHEQEFALAFVVLEN
ncbi:MAG TPA: holo-ACP synthase [Desulfarculaceae bacterium]|nr:holo-ACP synthase [Desulfarculaceae bacterium]